MVTAASAEQSGGEQPAVVYSHSAGTVSAACLAMQSRGSAYIFYGHVGQLLSGEELAAAGADLDLSGHTHHGQLFPGNVLIRLFWENPAGILQVGNMTSCVTQGAGVWGPAMRVGTDSEVMLLRVKFEV